MAGNLQVPLHPESEIYQFLITGLPGHLQAIFHAASDEERTSAREIGRSAVGKLLLQNRGAYQQLCIRRDTLVRRCKALPPAGALCSIVCVEQTPVPSHYVQVRNIDTALHLVNQEGQYLATLHAVFSATPRPPLTGVALAAQAGAVILHRRGKCSGAGPSRGVPTSPLAAAPAVSPNQDSPQSVGTLVIDEIAPETSTD